MNYGVLFAMLAFVATLRSVDRFTKGKPRVRTALSLVAANWAILIPYYSVLSAISSQPNANELQLRLELLPAIGGFLLAHAGAVLRREAAHAAGGKASEDSVTGWDRYLLWLLALAVSPAVPGVPLGTVPKLAIGTVFGTAMTVLGLLSISDGAWKLIRQQAPKPAQAIRIGAWIYAGTEIIFTIRDVMSILRNSVASFPLRGFPDENARRNVVQAVMC